MFRFWKLKSKTNQTTRVQLSNRAPRQIDLEIVYNSDGSITAGATVRRNKINYQESDEVPIQLDIPGCVLSAQVFDSVSGKLVAYYTVPPKRRCSTETLQLVFVKDSIMLKS